MAYWLVSNFTSLCFSSVESQIGASLVTMRWRGLELDEAKLRTNIKVKLTKRLLDLERKVLQDLMANQCDKCQQLVIFLMKEFRGYLTEVSLGCIQLTLFFSNIEDLQRGRSPDSISKVPWQITFDKNNTSNFWQCEIFFDSPESISFANHTTEFI